MPPAVVDFLPILDALANVGGWRVEVPGVLPVESDAPLVILSELTFFLMLMLPPVPVVGESPPHI